MDWILTFFIPAFSLAAAIFFAFRCRGLKKERDRLKVTLQSLPVQVFIKDMKKNGRYIFSNSAFARAFGKTPEMMIGKNVFDILSHDHAVRCDAADRESGPEFQFADYENLSSSSGEIYSCRIARKRLPVRGDWDLVLGCVQDVTREQRLSRCERTGEEALMRTLEEPDFAKVQTLIARAILDNTMADRVFLIHAEDDGELALHHEWCAEGTPSIAPVLDEYKKIWLRHKDALSSNRVLSISDVEHSVLYPKKMNGFDFCVRSVIASPIFLRGKFWGALVVEYERRKIDFFDMDESFARAMGNIVAMAILRHDLNDKIRQAENEKNVILENIRIPLWLFDGTGELLRANHEAGKLVGINPEDLTTAENRRIVARHLQGGGEPPVLEAIRTGKPVHRELQWQNLSYLVDAKPVYNGSGVLTYVVKSAFDVTGLKKFIENQKTINFCLETFLREEDADTAICGVLNAVRGYMQSDRAYIMRIDLKAHCVRSFLVRGKQDISQVSVPLNRAFPEDAPWLTHLLTRKSLYIRDIYAPETEKFVSGWRDLMEKNRDRSIFTTGIFVAGELYASFAVSYQKDIHDLTEEERNFLEAAGRMIELLFMREKMRKRLLSALEDARAADKAKSFFLASVSHEIRTPINALIGFSEILKDEKLSSDERKRCLDALVFSGESLLRLVNDVLDLSSLEVGKFRLERTAVDFKKLCAKVLSLFRSKIEAKGVALIEDISVPSNLLLDERRIRQILLNLVGNAVKFTEHGKITISASTQTSDGGKNEFLLRFSVADTGIGITVGDQTKIMEPFVRLSRLRGTNAENNGTGLGLAISRRLVREMGGEVFLSSEEGKGSVFSVEIPVSAGDSSDEHHPSENPRNTTETKNIHRNVLLVDDVKMNLQVLTAVCRRAGAESILCASSGREALALLREHPVDLILTDLWMPEMDGAQFAAAVREEYENPDLKIYAVTADTEAGRNFPCGVFSDVVLKPVTLNLIQALLQGKSSGVSAER